MEKREFIQRMVLKMVDEKTRPSDIIRFAANTYEAIEDFLAHEEKTKEKKEQSELNSTLLKDCNLLNATIMKLRAAGITRLGTLLMFSRNELAKFKAVGRKTIMDIEDFLDTMKLELPRDSQSIHRCFEGLVYGWKYKGKFYTQLEPLS